MWKLLRKLVLSLIVIVAIIGLVKREQITRLMAVNSLFAEEKIVGNFSNMDTMFLTRTMSLGDGPVSPLPDGTPATLPDETSAWITERALTGLVVLKDGQIVSEEYFQGTGSEDLRISWSVAKSFLSALFGILVEEGTIASLDDPVTKYAPDLAGSAYDGASLRNVLNMASGVEFDEDYLDFWSDINKMGRVLAMGGSLDDFAAALDEHRNQPGEGWHYVSIDTHVIGMVARGATGRSVPELLQEKVLVPMGLEAAPYYVTDGHGAAFVLGGLNLRTRDYARFGQMFLQGGAWNGAQIVPSDWVAASTKPSAPTRTGSTQYGYQWWIASDALSDGSGGEYFARGVYGQYIYINEGANVVIAVNSADRLFREPGSFEQNLSAFRAIAAAL
ncbi:MAG: serine hydrolase [Rhodobacteraceae bacterium]|nr:serine hydrolase [Paracoccaceae bacterium]